MKNNVHEYKYDIAISLCKEDVEFARQLVKALNPGLKVFFYEDRQEELISKSGPEAFARIFKDESRVVVILSRKEWSNTFYTAIERDAIIDSLKNNGFNFLFVIPMEDGGTPTWFPSTRLYADPQRFSIEDLAKFIEFKVTENGGDIKPITLEDQTEWLEAKMKRKRELVLLQETEQAISHARIEFKRIKDLFKEKSEYIKSKNLASYKYSPFDRYGIARFYIKKYYIECVAVMPEENQFRIFSTQDFGLIFRICKHVDDNRDARKKIEEVDYLFYYSETQKGWATPIEINKPTYEEELLLFKHRNNMLKYDLKNPSSSENIVDCWFQKLLKLSTININEII
ncbi:hypothetical protein SDC9_68682 [bioreactor metagenome]|uniref:TIR domain-containing protein n=1 Tax=bioreactor metagenome TaxID=1076179 RepID=A0A644Y2S7_9ZZZZ